MKTRHVIVLFFSCFWVSVMGQEEWLSEEETRIKILTLSSTVALIEIAGYPGRAYTVTTDDGYILQVHRIPYSPQSPSSADKPVVFLQHGLMGSSADWVLMGPDKDLAYILADLGYDVWLGNSRGNIYSREHERLSVNTSSFWAFSFHEMGIHDLPAVIDFVLAKTGQEKLFYVGHSQGTTQFYVMASERPEYNDKIKAMFSLAPMAFMEHSASPILRLLSGFVDDSEVLVFLLGKYKFDPNDLLVGGLVGQGECNETAVSPLMCNNTVFLTDGFDSKLLNWTMLPIILAHEPAGASPKHFVHLAQEINTPLFKQFDFRRGNVLQYGRSSPPEYDLTKITCPVALHYSDNDKMAHPKDVDHLYDLLVNPIGKFLVPLKSFNHLDFLWATDVKTLLYDKIIDLMSGYF